MHHWDPELNRVADTHTQNSVMIHPGLFDKIQPVIEKILIHSINQLEVSQIWKEVRLHYCYLHSVSSSTFKMPSHINSKQAKHSFLNIHAIARIRSCQHKLEFINVAGAYYCNLHILAFFWLFICKFGSLGYKF